MSRKEEKSLKEMFIELQGVVDWFKESEAVDVEEGLEKLKTGAVLIKDSRKRLKELENKFEEVQAELDDEEVDEVD